MKQKDLVILFGSSCILVLAWIGFTLYNKSVTSTIQETSAASVKPIPDSFDTATLEKVKAKLQIVPVYSVTSNVSTTPNPSQTPSRPSISPTPSRIETPTVTATPSAGVQI